jgi:hypothetical protein
MLCSESLIQLLRLALSKGPNGVYLSPLLKVETYPVFQALCFLVIEFRAMDKVRKPTDSEYYMPLRIYCMCIK